MKKSVLLIFVLCGLCLGQLNLNLDTWYEVKTTGDPPARRSSGNMVQIAEDLLLYHGGGLDLFFQNCSVFYNTTYIFNMTSGHWKFFPTTNAPEARQYASMWFFQGKVWHWAGGRVKCGPYFTPDGVRNDTIYADMHTLNITTGEWTLVTQNGILPPPRAYSGHTQSATHLYIAGGASRQDPDNDAWRFDPIFSNWTMIAANATPGPNQPPGRTGSALLYRDDPIYGPILIWTVGEIEGVGFGDRRLGDIWRLIIATGVWQNITHEDLEKLEDVCAATYGNRYIVLYGGDADNGTVCTNPGGCGNPFPVNPQDNTWVIDYVKNTVDRITQDFGVGAPRNKKCGLSLRLGPHGYVEGYMHAGLDYDFREQSGPKFMEGTRKIIFSKSLIKP
jgi:hypothetical protein